ncbi:Arc family DNA-binding protein [Acinetobacter baumannii]|nr:Arc family DNA-binding protein [Acinetobacter baumannii]MDC5524598.1 Arc family DNA-binding protein [Acinetobacter baumannii]MDC5640831.1 Arc family DNA-binding protein [Acinetobacter baumannii]MDC5675388.1 Arc family DNA-binding protein [Acinetobacter baumannii]MDC5686089.1 Arc family DNA-binding protein [Acinetobacter baumannii]
MSSGHLNAQYNLRLPDDLKQKIAQSAKELNRSMNADIVARLESSFEYKSIDNLEDIPLEKLLSAVMEKLGKNSLSLTREEIARGKELGKKSERN